MIIYNKLPIQIRKGLHDQIQLQFLMHGHAELLKLLKVFDHCQTMIVDRLLLVDLCIEKPLGYLIVR